LSAAAEGPPDVDLALEQHVRYVRALRDRGLDVIQLQPDEAHPDATFVEDTAIVTERGAVLTRPGAPSRRGEVQSIGQCLRNYCAHRQAIEAPGTVDGGDVCEAEGHFLIGVSARTNEHGAQQLAEHLGRWGYASSIIDIRNKSALLHLKSGIAYLGEALWVADAAIEDDLRSCRGVDRASRIVIVSPSEAYAANCVRVNDAVFMAAGYPLMRAALDGSGCRVVEIDVSEFRKMDGGLSCLSLRF
jgi:dimethylargininase